VAQVHEGDAGLDAAQIVHNARHDHQVERDLRPDVGGRGAAGGRGADAAQMPAEAEVAEDQERGQRGGPVPADAEVPAQEGVGKQTRERQDRQRGGDQPAQPALPEGVIGQKGAREAGVRRAVRARPFRHGQRPGGQHVPVRSDCGLVRHQK
jgi:hypothetical protein